MIYSTTYILKKVCRKYAEGVFQTLLSRTFYAASVKSSHHRYRSQQQPQQQREEKDRKNCFSSPRLTVMAAVACYHRYSNDSRGGGGFCHLAARHSDLSESGEKENF